MSTCNRAHACSVQGEQVKDETDERALGYPGWRVVAVCFAMAVVCWGFGFYGHAFYLAELQRLYGWPTSLVSSATTAYYFVSAVLVAFISDAVRRLGARACVLIGSSAFAVSVALLPFIVTPVHLFARDQERTAANVRVIHKVAGFRVGVEPLVIERRQIGRDARFEVRWPLLQERAHALLPVLHARVEHAERIDAMRFERMRLGGIAIHHLPRQRGRHR